MRPLCFLCIFFCASLAHAQSPSKIAVIPVVTSGDIAPPIAKKYDEKLRGSVAKRGSVLSVAAVAKAMDATGVRRDCKTDDCGEKVAKAGDARFVIFGNVTGADEIYTVTLLVYDAALSSQTAKVVKECELCTAAEVTDTVEEAVNGLSKALSAKAPSAKKAEKPKKEGMVDVSIKSRPAGASVAMGGIDKGVTPSKGRLTFAVKPGSYSIVVSKAGYFTKTRKVKVLDRPVKLSVKLKKDPKYVAPVAAVVAKPIAPKPKPADAEKKPSEPLALDNGGPESVGSAHNGLALGMALGGVALAGLGTWLVILDGEITCAAGTSRRECPNVYDTKGLGLVAYGVGAALVGAGAALFIEDLASAEASDNALKVNATPTADGAYLLFSGRF